MEQVTKCSHPIHRQSWWVAIDPFAPSGYVLVGACCECGEPLGEKTLPVIQPVKVRHDHAQ